MYTLKKILLILLVGAGVIIFASLFNSTDLVDRMLVLSMGIDLTESGEMIVLVETANTDTPWGRGGDGGGEGGGGGESGSSGEAKVASNKNTFSGRGATLTLALQDLYSKSGKVPSLGQCNVIIFGESFYRGNCLYSQGQARAFNIQKPHVPAKLLFKDVPVIPHGRFTSHGFSVFGKNGKSFIPVSAGGVNQAPEAALPQFTAYMSRSRAGMVFICKGKIYASCYYRAGS